MHKIVALSALSLALSGFTVSANAFSFSYTVGQFVSTEPGASTETFSGGLPANYTGGGLFTSSSTNVTATPVGAEGNFWSVGITSGQIGPGVITFANPVSYFGFLWGSPDAYNTITFYSGASVLASLDGSAIKLPPDGDQSYSAYFNAYADPGASITKITFESSLNAFETDNHAYITAIPEPRTYAMLLTGLGLMGFMAKRKMS